MFNVGDKIVYPMHGAGTIDAIEEKDILGEKQSYYILKMPGEVKVMVPTDKAEQIGVRNIIDKSSASKVFEILEEDETEMSMNWNKRYRDNMEKMKSGDIYEVADVVRNLSFKQKEKGLSTGEKKMLHNAKQILVSELVLAEHATQDEVDIKILDEGGFFKKAKVELILDKENREVKEHESGIEEKGYSKGFKEGQKQLQIDHFFAPLRFLLIRNAERPTTPAVNINIMEEMRKSKTVQANIPRKVTVNTAILRGVFFIFFSIFSAADAIR